MVAGLVVSAEDMNGAAVDHNVHLGADDAGRFLHRQIHKILWQSEKGFVGCDIRPKTDFCFVGQVCVCFHILAAAQLEKDTAEELYDKD